MSLLDGWFAQAGVRTDEPRVFTGVDDGADEGTALFSAAEVPELTHPLLDGLDERLREQLLAQHLYRYLLFTVHLETRVVNRAMTRMSTADPGFAMSDRLREDALKIYVDEGFHALANVRLVRQVADETGIRPVEYSFEPVLASLDAPIADAPTGYARVRELLQATVFETLVTSTLDGVPKDQSVHPTVRAVVADHARDERVHHAFFVRLFPELWASLDARTRSVVARDLPRIVHACVAPDLLAAARSLRSIGYGDAHIEQVLGETYDAATVTARTRRIARHTLRLLRNTGVFDTAEAHDAFAAASLLVDDDVPEQRGRRSA